MQVHKGEGERKGTVVLGVSILEILKKRVVMVTVLLMVQM